MTTLSALALAVATGTIAHPQGSTELREEACDAEMIAPRCELAFVDVEAIERLLCVELASSAVTATSALAISFADTPCMPENAGLAVEISAGPDFEVERLTLPLAEVAPETRARTAALLILEHVRDLRASIAAAPPLAQTTRREEAISPELTRPRFDVFATAGVRYVPSFAHPLFGARAGATYAFSEELRLAFDAGADRYTKTHALGDVELTLLTGGAALEYARALGDEFDVAIGPRLEVGWAHASGSAFLATTTERDASDTVIIAAIRARAAFDFARAWSIFIEPELGAALRGFDSRVNDARALGVSGVLLRASVGVRWSALTGD